MVKLAAFDLDGTIGDTISLCIRAFKEAVEPYLLRELSEEEIVRTFGLNEEGMIRQVAEANWRQALDDFYGCYARLHRTMCPHPFDGIAQLIRKLRENAVLTALVTGKGERSCAITLDRFGMADCFDAVETGSPYENRKAGAIGGLLKKFCLQAGEAVYIGDTVSDVLACRAVGVECLSAAWAAGAPVAALEAVNAGKVVGSPAALADRLLPGAV